MLGVEISGRVHAQLTQEADGNALRQGSSGRLAPCMARAHFALRPALQEVAVWGRDAAAARALADSLALEGLPAVAVQDLVSAAQMADIVCCATTAVAPVVQGAWLRAGTHLDVVGAFRPRMREVDDAVRRSRIVVDGPGAWVEAGDLVQTLTSGCIMPADVAGDLADLLCGRLPARQDGGNEGGRQEGGRHDLSLFKSVGMALQDLAAAQAVLASASHDQ